MGRVGLALVLAPLQRVAPLEALPGLVRPASYNNGHTPRHATCVRHTGSIRAACTTSNGAAHMQTGWPSGVVIGDRGHIAQMCILHRWPYCTCRPYCTGGH